MGYLPESLPIYPELAVLNTCNMRLDWVFGRQICVQRAINLTGLSDKALDSVSTLSRIQEVGVAQSILHEPKSI